VGEKLPGPDAVPLDAKAASNLAGEAPPGAVDDVPWSPAVCGSNVWPYDHAVHIATDYCGPPGEFWLRGEYLLWALKADHLPPLVTAGPAGSGAVLGNPGVVTLFGGNADPGAFQGGRFTGGVWFNSCYTVGFEGNYLFLAEKSLDFGIGSSGLPGSLQLGRPFIDVLTGLPMALPITTPGVASGAVTASLTTELQSAEANFVWNVYRSCKLSADVLTGFRYMELGGDLSVLSVTNTLATGASTSLLDEFGVRNHFYGGQIGGRAEFRWHQLVCTVTEKLALGGNEADILITGGTAVNGTQTTGAGLLVQETNAGRHFHDSFSVVNEFGLQLGWQPCDYVQVFAGYTLLVASSVVRPEQVIDFGVNPTVGVAGPARPGLFPQETGFWAQGLNVGLEIRY
jgi:hypothetical protein